MDEKRTYITVYVPRDYEYLVEWLAAEAERQDRTVNAVIVRLLAAVAKEQQTEEEVDAKSD